MVAGSVTGGAHELIRRRSSGGMASDMG